MQWHLQHFVLRSLWGASGRGYVYEFFQSKFSILIATSAEEKIG
jgi:hypothetical protein